MAFTPYQGSDGRVSVFIITPDLDLPRPANPVDATVAVAGITKWAIEFEDEHGEPIHHFESPATSSGMLWGEEINGGTQSWRAPIEGYIDGDTSSSWAKFQNGAWVKADFIYDKATSMGHHGNLCKVSQFKTLGPDVKGGPVKFSCVLRGSGALDDISTS